MFHTERSVADLSCHMIYEECTVPAAASGRRWFRGWRAAQEFKLTHYPIRGTAQFELGMISQFDFVNDEKERVQTIAGN